MSLGRGFLPDPQVSGGRVFFPASSYRKERTIAVFSRSSHSRVRVLIVDDSRTYAETLELLLGADERIEIVGCAFDGAEGVQRALEVRRDVVDDQGPPGEGLQCRRGCVPGQGHAARRARRRRRGTGSQRPFAYPDEDLPGELQRMIRLLVCDDAPEARELVSALLSTQPGIEIVGEAANGQE